MGSYEIRNDFIIYDFSDFPLYFFSFYWYGVNFFCFSLFHNLPSLNTCQYHCSYDLCSFVTSCYASSYFLSDLYTLMRRCYSSYNVHYDLTFIIPRILLVTLLCIKPGSHHRHYGKIYWGNERCGAEVINLSYTKVFFPCAIVSDVTLSYHTSLYSVCFRC